jgi:hypothetical protein
VSTEHLDAVTNWIGAIQTGVTFTCAFAALYTGHMVGDHIAQTDGQAAGKAKPFRDGELGPLLAHVASYTVCQMAAIYAVLAVTGLHVDYRAWLAGIGFSAVTHGFIDRRWPVQWLCRNTGSEAFGKLAGNGLNGAYLVDQTLHIACLFASALIMAGGTR